ncbi:MAG: penicillin-binding protein 2 [Bacilli bacterium]|nr:penicillin-binding protein 2 [Bacilli bacterium]
MKKKTKPINNYKYLEQNVKRDKIIEKRYKVLIVLIILVMSSLIAKLTYIQVYRHDYYATSLEEMTHKVFYGESTPRGRIYDRNGNILVDNIAVKTIYYKKPTRIMTSEEIKTAYLVANYIDVDYSRLNDYSLRQFWVESYPKEARKKITDEEIQLLKERKITNNDIYKYKIERVTEEELEKFKDIDYEAAYIYYLMNKGYSYAEKAIKNKDVTEEEYAIIAEHLDELKGINVKLDWERYYPYGDTLKTIFGTVSTSESGLPLELKDYYLNNGYSLTDRVGVSYLEYQYESFLKGKKATYELLDDGSYKVIDEGVRGNDLVLTIDINLQQEVDRILEEELIIAQEEPNTEYFDKSFVIVANPNTGEILAMSGKKVVKDDNGEYKIKDYTPGVITSSVTPGSIVKGASHIVGYNTGALKIGERRNDGCIKIAATPLKCSLYEYGYIDDLQALKYSSNTYQFHTAINVGHGNYVYDGPLVIDENAFNIYRETFKQFGLGTKTGIDLPNEALGYMGKNTLSGLLLDYAIGQYDTYTPIEISQYIGTIANGGNRMRPYLLKEVFSSQSSEPLTESLYKTEPQVLNKVETTDEYLNRVKEGFRQVMLPGGTGYTYIDEEHSPAGKTGTSQSFIDTDNDGKIDTETITTNFVGYAPLENPTVTFTIISPDVATADTDHYQMSAINKRITQKVSQKYFEIYQ